MVSHGSRGKRFFRSDSPYGRVTVVRHNGQHTLFCDGIPTHSSVDVVRAEETVHFAMAQAAHARRILLISGTSGMMKELAKYGPGRVDFVEVNPDAALAGFRFGIYTRYDWLRVLSTDGRAYLQQTAERYDVIIVSLPEPGSYQINRFFTREFFREARSRLTEGGVFCFSVDGYDNYLNRQQRKKISLIFRSVAPLFDHLLLLPAARVSFLCSDRPLSGDIPALLAGKGIETTYLADYYDGDVSSQRIQYLADLVVKAGPANTDLHPRLLRTVLSQWMDRVQSSPRLVIAVALLLAGLFVAFLPPRGLLLFSTGMTNMGFEILVILSFQIAFGYLYESIGLLVTVFLAGLLPGALLGKWLSADRGQGSPTLLLVSELLLVIALTGFTLLLQHQAVMLPEWVYFFSGFLLSMVCGIQYPLLVSMEKDRISRATAYFAADIMGAACGIIVISMVAIPFGGLLWAGYGLAALKGMSLFLFWGTGLFRAGR
jgi:spermidine synthase